MVAITTQGELRSLLAYLRAAERAFRQIADANEEFGPAWRCRKVANWSGDRADLLEEIARRAGCLAAPDTLTELIDAKASALWRRWSVEFREELGAAWE